MRGVLSHDPALSTLKGLWVGFAFHAFSMIGGIACVQAARRTVAGAAAPTA